MMTNHQHPNKSLHDLPLYFQDQARNAKQHGTAFRGHTISIALTSKHPSTQVLSTAPVPHSSTLLNLIIQQPPTPVATTTNKPISSYFANAPGSSASAKLGGQVNKDVRPIPLPPPPAAHENATNVTSSAPCPSPIAHFSGKVNTTILSITYFVIVF